ncbi:hypothetical protein BG003_000931 [Podila horticola]|nr:hypothetical protein BG003_000931 [Podila horticola]
MDVKVGWSVLNPDTGSPVSLDQYYKALELKDDDYYGNSARATGILQPPAFHADNPEYANYGAIGHGFGNQGHMFDSKGKMENWWTNSTEEAFNTHVSCFVDQYGNFTIKDPNLVDNGGLKKAFETWQARYKADPSGKTIKNQRLPGLEALTPEQLFFVSYARMWCSKMRPEALLQ